MDEKALKTAQNLIIDKAVDEAKDKVIEEVMGEMGKKIFGYATIFVSFVDTYSKAVKEANLETVRRNLEVCPHIGGCENYIHATKIADNTTATVWQAPDAYWYFHPQFNYRVRHARQIFRSTEDGGWRIEQPGKSKVRIIDCLACVQAHGSGAN